MTAYKVMFRGKTGLMTLDDPEKCAESDPPVDSKIAEALRPYEERSAEAVAAALAELELSHRRCDEAMAECGELAAQLAVADHTIKLLRAAIRRESEKLAEVTRKLELAAK